MDRELFLGVDQGSGSTKAVLINLDGKVVKEFVVRIDSTRVLGDHVEQNPDELYLSVKNLIDEAFNFVRPYSTEIIAIGLAFQRSGVLAWDRNTGEAKHPMITWADTRSAKALEAIPDTSLVTEKTSLPVTPHYAAPKIALLQKEFPEDDVLVGTLDSFVLHRLSELRTLSTDDTMASRTMLYDLSTGSWDAGLCEIFGVNRERLVPISPSLHPHARYQDVPILSILGDQQASLFGRLGPEGYPVLNMGTVSSLCVPLGSDLIFQPGFVSSVLCSRQSADNPDMVDSLYLLEALTNASGSIVEHIRKKRLASSLEQVASICEHGSHGGKTVVAFVPLGGSASPDWRYDLPNLIMNWDGVNTEALVRALIENIGCFVSNNIRTLTEAGIIGSEERTIVASGGLSEMDFLLQFIADCSGYRILRMGSREATARGAAISAIMSAGRSDNPAGLNVEAPERVFDPHQSQATKKLEMWLELKRHALEGRVLPGAVEYPKGTPE